MTEMMVRDAIAHGIREALESSEDVFVMGEDIGAYQGSYAVTRGFLEEYGPERIRDTPISESVVVGAGIGAAVAGLRPIIEIMTINFMLLPMDQIVNHAAKLRYMSNGQISVPIVIRAVTGGGMQLGATHSQSFEGMFASVPGLKVVVPSNPYDALGLFRSAVADDDPVIYAEHGRLYTSISEEVPDEYYDIPFGKASVKREGSDVTIVAYSRMVHTALEAAQTLAAMGIEVEVIDLRTLRPWDTDSVVESVKKTGIVIVVEEAWKTGGFSGEIASVIQEEAFEYLDAPVRRVAGKDVPAPYAGNIESIAFPDAREIVEVVKELCGV